VIERRVFLAAAAGALLTAPRTAAAQQSQKVPRIGFLDAGLGFGPPFLDGLRELGYIEGKSIAIEWRHAHARAERFPELAAELTRLNVDVIVAANNPAASAARDATKTIPIVMAIVTDPVGLGLVPSLARPAGNITGLTIQSPELSGKRLQLLKEAVPRLTRVGVLWDANEPGRRALVTETEAAAARLGLPLRTYEPRGPGEIEGMFTAMAKEGVGALIVYGSSMLYVHRGTIGQLAAKHHIPMMGPAPEWLGAGFVMSYSPSLNDMFRRTAYFVDKILKGAKPADLPIEQPSTFVLVLNLKVARALGLTIPPALQARADQVID